MLKQTLSKNEMQIMNILWSMQRNACVNDVIEHFPEPRPAYTTVATFLKRLSLRGYVEYKKGEGKQYVYSPLISKATYRKKVMEEVKDICFDGSAKSLIDFFVQEEMLSDTEVSELLILIQNTYGTE